MFSKIGLGSGDSVERGPFRGVLKLRRNGVPPFASLSLIKNCCQKPSGMLRSFSIIRGCFLVSCNIVAGDGLRLE